jgi:hypothetical protein
MDLDQFHPHCLAVGHCRCRCQTLWLTDQAAFTDEFVRSEDRNDRFLALFGDNGNFDLSAFDVEDGIRRVPLGKNDRLWSMSRNSATLGCRCEKYRRIKPRSFLALHDALFDHSCSCK